MDEAMADQLLATDLAEPETRDAGLARVLVPERVGAAHPPGITRRDFFDRVVTRTRQSVAAEHADFVARPFSQLMKIHFSNERVHFEIAPDSHHDRIEIALHFEDGPVSTAAYLQFFDARIVELKHQLGPTVELERWTSSWGRIYEMIPLLPFNAATANRTADHLTCLIDTLQPLIEIAAVDRERVDEAPGQRRHWRRARR